VGNRCKKLTCPGVGSAKFISRKKIKRRPLRGGKIWNISIPTAASLCSLQWATLLHPLCGLKNVRRMFAKLEKGTPDSFRSESRMTREDIGMTREDVGTAREDVGIAREDVGMARDWKCAEFAP